MPYQIVKFQNVSPFPFPGNPPPTIQISIEDEGWNLAYHEWTVAPAPEWKQSIPQPLR